MTIKQFYLPKDKIRKLIPQMGGCLATDKITVEGSTVGYMYRDKPANPQDSGWRFFAGDEDSRYINNISNHGVYDVNTICNYDINIIPFLDAPAGNAFEKDLETGKFLPVEN